MPGGMRKSVSITFDETLWAVFRLACIRKGLTASRVFEAYMVAFLEEWKVDVEEAARQLRKKEGTP